jgi:hypothetical protein
MNTAMRRLIAAALLAACSGTPATVDRLTVVNPTDYDLDVHVMGGDREVWVPLAIVAARSEDVVEDVIDQGDQWTFRFLHWGDSLAERSLGRAELERNGWRVDVPPEVGERLRELGRPPSD